MSLLRKPKPCSSRSPSSSTESIPKPHHHPNAIIKSTHHSNSNTHNFTSMVKKFMEKKPKTKTNFIIPTDLIAEDLKKSARPKSSNFPKKLFGVGSSEKKMKPPALTEVKTNTRTLAMVLKSERELLNSNKDQEEVISQLQSLLLERNREVDKLKDLCLKQREEIKALKNAVLFPEEMNMQLHNMLEKQGSELNQARKVIPSLQKQISSLTGQLQILSKDIAEVKAVKYNGSPSIEGNYSSPRTPFYDQQEAANSLDFSDDDPTTPDSPDDMLLKDVNPCLTPCYSKTKSKEYRAMGRELHDYTPTEEGGEMNAVRRDSRTTSRSSDQLRPGNRNSTACAGFRRSDESKYRYANPLNH